jgi:hypothetical protein
MDTVTYSKGDVQWAEYLAARQEPCAVQGDHHLTGETTAACEGHIRHVVERAGGTGQLLASVKADHRERAGGW